MAAMATLACLSERQDAFPRADHTALQDEEVIVHFAVVREATLGDGGEVKGHMHSGSDYEHWRGSGKCERLHQYQGGDGLRRRVVAS